MKLYKWGQTNLKYNKEAEYERLSVDARLNEEKFARFYVHKYYQSDNREN